MAAPILPGISTAAQAELLSRLAGASDEELPGLVAAQPGVDHDLDAERPLRRVEGERRRERQRRQERARARRRGVRGQRALLARQHDGLVDAAFEE